MLLSRAGVRHYIRGREIERLGLLLDLLASEVVGDQELSKVTSRFQESDWGSFKVSRGRDLPDDLGGRSDFDNITTLPDDVPSQRKVQPKKETYENARAC